MKFIKGRTDLSLWSHKFIVVWGFSLSGTQNKRIWAVKHREGKIGLLGKQSDKSHSYVIVTVSFWELKKTGFWHLKYICP